MTMTTEKNNAVTKYAGKSELARMEAKEIIEALFPEAPLADQQRAILTCVSYRLNPLNKHVFLIPFNKGKENETWSLVMGIKAKRLLANRPVPGTREARPFSYIDDSPRIMTEDEQIKIYGELQTGKLMTIVILQDPKSGAIARGYGAWPVIKKIWSKTQNKYIEVPNDPQGSDKGNSMFNMSTIRAESQALDRLRPGEMPSGVQTVDDRVIEGEYKEVVNKTAIDSAEKMAIETASVDPETGEIILDESVDKEMSSDEAFNNLQSATGKTQPQTEAPKDKENTAKTTKPTPASLDTFKALDAAREAHVITIGGILNEAVANRKWKITKISDLTEEQAQILIAWCNESK